MSLPILEIVKGNDCTLEGPMYFDWTGQPETSTLATLSDTSIVKLFAKLRTGDSDASAVFILDGVVSSVAESKVTVVIPAAITNILSYTRLYYELVVKLDDGTYLHPGAGDMFIEPNVGHELF
jgi:hypothetical protein